MKKDLKHFIIFLFIFPIIPEIILWLKFKSVKIIVLLLIFWSAGFLCLISKNFAKAFKNTIDKILSFLGKYLAIIILFFGYIFVVVPTALIMKMTKRDRLRLKSQNVSSYWLDENEIEKDYERQF